MLAKLKELTQQELRDHFSLTIEKLDKLNNNVLEQTNNKLYVNYDLYSFKNVDETEIKNLIAVYLFDEDRQIVLHDQITSMISIFDFETNVKGVVDFYKKILNR